ncbi:hypothetical protein NKOR_03885 [Candidatus Nitrosopumilus koreensis AR1]|uniref:Uncharacterized protein n=1 Tax=Candidatus Nitrosopumilus koreensis AR1 TaxID=1229908 RepID=K0B692_9ARCH|nr:MULTISPECIES: hypothetical protein [Nitrosopumilus]AFS80667.1 hypothetical protein NKOR_03885 [Candidatus Nitrosopumilus koreensis AR1]
MKFVLLLILIGMITPVFAQESSFDEQLMNSTEYSKIIDRLYLLENENKQLENLIHNFDDGISSKLSKIDESLIQSGDVANKSLWLGLYISMVFAGIAIAATIIYSIKLGSQTKLIETDIKTRIRPILSRKELRKKITNSTEQHVGELHTLSKQKALFHFQNTGTLPAVNISRNYYAEIRETPSNEIKLDPTKYVDAFKMASLAPNEYYSTDIFWLDPCFDDAVDKNTCYFGLIIWYHDSKGTRYHYHIEGYFDKGEMMLNHVDMD